MAIYHHLQGYPQLQGHKRLLERLLACIIHTTQPIYIIDLNLIIYRSLPGFEPRSPGTKAATLPLTGWIVFCLS